MNRIITLAVLSITFLILLMAGCDKEKIVQSTEYIEKTEYIESPPDTLFLIDTVFYHDSTTIQNTDTVFVIDTILITNIVHDTTYLYDTITTVQYLHDTVYISDTVTNGQCAADEAFAFSAAQYYTNPLVLDYIYSEFGYDDGWVFYLTQYQSDLTQQSSTVYDIYGFIDYWTPEFDGYYALEYYWRLTYSGGDPSDMDNWQLSDPPSGAAYQPGLRPKSDVTQSQGLTR